MLMQRTYSWQPIDVCRPLGGCNWFRWKGERKRLRNMQCGRTQFPLVDPLFAAGMDIIGVISRRDY
jgi:hypothetical protein